MALSIDINDNSERRPVIRTTGFRRPENLTSQPARDVIKNPERKKKIKKIVFAILGVFLLVGGVYAFRMYKLADSLGLKIGASDILNPIKKDPELKKDSTGKYTGVLIVGIDSGRAAGDGNMNTDTIMVANYNYETNETVMVSIPRDFAVELPNNPGIYSKINAIYADGERREKGKGLKDLSKVVKDVTGIEIQYYGMIDLQGFRKLIDAVGGITVNVENTFTDYCYPAEKDSKKVAVGTCAGTKYLAEIVTFQKGPQKMDGTTALKYARSRLSSTPGEGGDYARAKRQQKVVSALKDALLSTETYLNPQKILEIIAAVQENVRVSEFTSSDIQAGINLVKTQSEKNGRTYSFVLEPAIGNSSVVTDSGFPPSVSTLGSISGPKAGLGNYTQTKEIVSLFMKQPTLYTEDPVIFVYNNGLGYQETYQESLKLQEQFPYLYIRFMGNTAVAPQSGVVVYDQTDATKPNSVKYLSNFLKTEKTSKPDYITGQFYTGEVIVLFGQPEQEVESENVN